MTKLAIALMFIWFSILNAQEIRFAPIPKESVETIEKGYKPFLNWLSKQTGDKYTLVMTLDYKDLTSKIEKGEIDMAYLGPLPYAIIKQHINSIVPIVKFLDESGKPTYTCSIIVRANSNIKSLKELENKKISLTQKYSTCGYYNAKIAFDQEGIPLSQYSFAGSHSKVAFNVTTGTSDGGSLQTSYYNKYQYLGLRKIYESKPLPGFLIAVNKNKIDSNKISAIKKAITTLSPLTNPKDREITKDWIDNIRYGAVEAKEEDYAAIIHNAKNMSDIR